jgi:excisionase family DNA binding protein
MPPDLAARLALRPKEAAEALGISERKLREMLPELPHTRLGGVVMIPVKPLESWLAERAKAEAGRADKVAQEIIDDLNEF